MTNDEKLCAVEKMLSGYGYDFKNKSILCRAITLSSSNLPDNQTLEFLGDAVVELCVTEHIFDIDGDEGALTIRRSELVSDKSLTLVSQKLGLEKLLIKSGGDKNNKKAVPSSYEAIVGAVYLDGGFLSAKNFVEKTLNFNCAVKTENYKGELQEYLQGKKLPLPEYFPKGVETTCGGMQTAVARVSGKEYEGRALRIKDAEQLAARSALEDIKNSDNTVI